MTTMIGEELTLISVCVGLGMLLAFAYDMIRVLRLLFLHKSWMVDVEDLLFWIATAWIVFCVLFHYNNGVLRGYAFWGLFGGCLFYCLTFSRIILAGVRKILPYFRKTNQIICKPFTKICRWIRKGLKNLDSQVKMAMKSR